MRISTTRGMSAAANWQKSATESEEGTARTHTISLRPSGNSPPAAAAIAVVLEVEVMEAAAVEEAATTVLASEALEAPEGEAVGGALMSR
jgi:hypothetical protein